MFIGAQLYTVRKYLGSNEGIDEAFRKSREAGYDCVQYSGAPDGGNFDPDFLKSVIDKYNLPVTLTHVSFDRLLQETENEIKKHIAIGCRNIGIGGVPTEKIVDEGKLAEVAEQLNRITDKINSAGCKFYYHNHCIEFYRLKNGQTILDYLIEKVPGMNITLDTHWVQRGGADVVETINRLHGKLECVHLKDYKVNEKWEAKFAPVGDGNLNWNKILPAFEKAGAKYAFVEQDDAENYGDPFDCLIKSRKNLEKLGYPICRK